MVMKFGGTSLESTAAIARAVEIVRARRAWKPMVVVSAMGKTTNCLLAMAADAAAGNLETAMGRRAALAEYHRREALPLVDAQWRDALARLLEKDFNALAGSLRALAAAGELTPYLVDEVAAYGEVISSQVVTKALESAGVPAAHVDARAVVKTDAHHTQAAPLLAETYAGIAAAVREIGPERVAVMGGFIGAAPDGTTTTLGRGGSDYSAALAGAATGAEEIQIWTDVDGVLTCDPRIVPEARPVKSISFDEAAELAYFGAKVLHPATVMPAKEKNIPVRILNSRWPEAPGTTIVGTALPCGNVLKSVACKPGVTVVNIRSNRMLMAHGFLRKIFEVFDRFETPVDMLSTSEVSVSLTVDSARRLEEICRELRPFTEVSVERDQAILCAVGDNIRHTPNVAARVFGALRHVNVRMISQGASQRNLGLVVNGEDLNGAAQALHREFFTELDPAVFG